MLPPGRRLAVLAALVALAVPLAKARAKKDILTLENGDHWVCEVKNLRRGYLYVGLDYVDGTVSVDWSKVRSIESPQLFLVEDPQGTIYTGSFSSEPGPRGGRPRMVIVDTAARHSLEHGQVVQIDQLESGFWAAIHGSVDGGLNFVKSSASNQYNFNASATRRRERWWQQAEFHSTLTTSETGGGSSRNNLTMQVQRLFRENYVAGLLTDFLQSEEQQLRLRTTLGAGFGRLFKNTNHIQALGMLGAVWTREKYSPEAISEPFRDNGEAMIRSSLGFYRFKTLSAALTLSLYPSFTDLGRVRFDGNSSVRFQLVKDLYWSFNAYANFDSRPPEHTVRSDYGVSSGLGWTF